MKTRISDDLQRKVSFWAPLFQIKARWVPFLLVFSGILQKFLQILPRFPRILPGFSPNQKTWVHLHPASYTTAYTCSCLLKLALRIDSKVLHQRQRRTMN